MAGRARNGLWPFSLRFYRRAGVASACLELQDRLGADVNLLLFALWHGASGRGRLGGRELAALSSAVAPWQSQVVIPLRAIRRRLKGLAGQPVLASFEPTFADLRQRIQAAELTAEAFEQAMLEATAEPKGQRAGPKARLADGCANLRTYLRRLGWRKSRPAAMAVAYLESAFAAALGRPRPATQRRRRATRH